ncbi:hypothetical protein KCV01_g15659, partial [Aureobasidium melanogenum]
MTSAPPVPPSRGVALLFALACGLCVANIYYAQPLLDAIGREFGIPDARLGQVMTAAQVGCGLALVFLVPLGDRVERRRLMLIQSLALTASLAAVAFAPSWPLLLAGMVGIGTLGTAMTQGLIAYAASIAPPVQRGQVVGVAQSGVLMGLLLARVVSGTVGDIAGWRGMFICSAVASVLLVLLLRMALPRTTVAPVRLGYLDLLRSMPVLLREERVLQVRGMLALLMFATFNIFWNAMVLPLSTPPRSLSHAAIGAFGLVGALGALVAARAGRWADRGHGARTSAGGLILLTLSWLPLLFMDRSLAALMLGIVLLDMGGQALHVTNQSMVFSARPEAHSRMVGLYMLFYAVGSGSG